MKNKILLQIGSAGILVIIGSLASFASNILLGRTLSQEDFGVFSLFRSVMFLLPVLAFLGYGNAMIRFAKENDFSTTNWKQSLQKINIYCSYSCAEDISILFRSVYFFRNSCMDVRSRNEYQFNPQDKRQNGAWSIYNTGVEIRFFYNTSCYLNLV